MDPFEKLPEEIFDGILRHIDINDILFKLSLVSKKWYEIIGKSSVCMDKVKLNLRANRKTDFKERIELLEWMSKKEARKYVHIKSNCLLNENISLEFYKFLKTCSSLESLNVRSIKVDQDQIDKFDELSIPKLESLKLMFVPREVINRFILSSCNLKKVILWNEVPLSYDNLNYLPTDSTIECVRQFMLNNQYLEELEIQGRANFYSFFHQDISSYVKCQLKKFTLKIEMSPQLLTESQEENFLKFLSTQAESLEHVYVDVCEKNILEYIFSKLPQLQSIRFDIELRDPNRFDVKELNLQPCEKISKFELPYVKLFDDVEDYLNLVPNVKHLLIGHIVPRLIDYATTHLLQLETLTYRYDDCAAAEGCQGMYDNLKNEKPEINKNIVLSVCNDFL